MWPASFSHSGHRTPAETRQQPGRSIFLLVITGAFAPMDTACGPGIALGYSSSPFYEQCFHSQEREMPSRVPSAFETRQCHGAALESGETPSNTPQEMSHATGSVVHSSTRRSSKASGTSRSTTRGVLGAVMAKRPFYRRIPCARALAVCCLGA